MKQRVLSGFEAIVMLSSLMAESATCLAVSAVLGNGKEPTGIPKIDFDWGKLE